MSHSTGEVNVLALEICIQSKTRHNTEKRIGISKGSGSTFENKKNENQVKCSCRQVEK